MATVRMAHPWTDPRTNERYKVGATPDLDDRTADRLIAAGRAVAHERKAAAKGDDSK